MTPKGAGFAGGRFFAGTSGELEREELLPSSSLSLAKALKRGIFDSEGHGVLDGRSESASRRSLNKRSRTCCVGKDSGRKSIENAQSSFPSCPQVKLQVVLSKKPSCAKAGRR